MPLLLWQFVFSPYAWGGLVLGLLLGGSVGYIKGNGSGRASEALVWQRRETEININTAKLIEETTAKLRAAEATAARRQYEISESYEGSIKDVRKHYEDTIAKLRSNALRVRVGTIRAATGTDRVPASGACSSGIDAADRDGLSQEPNRDLDRAERDRAALAITEQVAATLALGHAANECRVRLHALQDAVRALEAAQ